MSVEIDVVYEGELRCIAEHGPSKSRFQTEAPVDNGGRGAAFSPTDLVAAALGSCLLTIIGLWAQRSGQDLRGTKVSVQKEMAPQAPRRIALLRMTVTFARAFPPEVRERMERVADTCPVRLSLHPDTRVETRYVYPS